MTVPQLLQLRSARDCPPQAAPFLPHSFPLAQWLVLDIRVLRRVNLQADSGAQLSLLRGCASFVCACLVLSAERAVLELVQHTR